MAKEKTNRKIQINNKRASFDYEFLETYEAGIVLVGTEIKSLRAGKASLSDAYCYFSNGELYVKGMNISTYFWASAWSSHEPGRDRKLLLHSKELRSLANSVKQKGLTIVAVKLYINDEGMAKLLIALARGKKEFDKRATIKEKDIRREMERG
ncbi:MAG: SsrA-binding protein SmpB [Bacteroidales bacterium]|nr:SsrA-binding protein SmpB [Bacteroidales bacterium]MCI5483323.1 SsrA-binding protein SmpB [Bacteroidales bacterium]MDD6751667.1 SsrA-binding protein SmpB [Bacteroidales bacterium]MDY2878475.1 SsrA-binding protein SmpB [Candidatus Cryptobacteroides sp.]